MILICNLEWIVLASTTYKVSTAAFLATVRLPARGKGFPLLVPMIVSLKILLDAGAPWFASSILNLINITISLRVVDAHTSRRPTRFDI